MKVLVIGSGGREHAICWKLLESPEVEEVYCAPGNGGTEAIATNVELDSIEMMLDFALDKKIDLTVVGPEGPLVDGIVDRFEDQGLRIFGVNQECAQLEGSKIYSKSFMERHGIATAKYKVYRDFERARDDLDSFSYPIVIKADGLCAGKGVVICEDRKMALETLDGFLNNSIFGRAGEELIIEEFLEGVEASLLCLVSGGRIIPMESAKDYKQIYDGDQGPNTGGVGCFSPSPLFTEGLKKKIRTDVLDRIEAGFQEDGLDFTGLLFIGFMIGQEIKVLEFNVRFGDPETEVVLPRLRSDLFKILNKTIDGSLEEKDLVWTNEKAMTVVLTSEGYPGQALVDREISLGEINEETIIFHNGTRWKDGRLYSAGGRVLSISQLGPSLDTIGLAIYKDLEEIDLEGSHYRKDIGS